MLHKYVSWNVWWMSKTDTQYIHAADEMMQLRGMAYSQLYFIVWKIYNIFPSSQIFHFFALVDKLNSTYVLHMTFENNSIQTTCVLST